MNPNFDFALFNVLTQAEREKAASLVALKKKIIHQIFTKAPGELLTPMEQDILEEIIAIEQPQEVVIDENDPIFRSALKLCLNLRKDNIASWEKISEAIWPENKS